jgi:hypothetical protein
MVCVFNKSPVSLEDLDGAWVHRNLQFSNGQFSNGQFSNGQFSNGQFSNGQCDSKGQCG